MVIKYPEIEVQLVGEDGNAMSIMARVNQALRRGGVDKAERDEYMSQSMSGNYDNVLTTAMAWVSCS